jgi:SAM-dependent methyltransferase
MDEALLKERYLELHRKYLPNATDLDQCPVCKSRDFTALFPFLVRICTHHSYFPNGDKIRMCNLCGTFMVDRVYLPAYYQYYINLFYGVCPAGPDPNLKKKAEIRLSILEDICRTFDFKPKNVLEVSSYDGSTLDYIRSNMGVTVAGVEPTSQAVSYAGATYPELSGKIHNSVFEASADFCRHHAPFDIAVLSYCFRQMSAPLVALDILRDCLAPGGYVLFDEGALLADCLNSRNGQDFIHQLHQQKNFYYSQHSLVFMLQRMGFEYVRSYRFHGEPLLGYTGTVFRYTGKGTVDLEQLEMGSLLGQSMAALYNHLAKSDEDVLAALYRYG